MRAYILGINHQIQWVKLWSAGSSAGGGPERFEREQKDKFRELLRKRIAERNAQFVGEETKHGEPAIAHEVCDSVGCRYENIEMPLEERKARKIPPNYENDRTIQPSEMDRFNKLREDFMFRKFFVEAGGEESAIAICGRNHAATLAERFRSAHHTVEVADIQEEFWYVEDWQTQMMRL